MGFFDFLRRSPKRQPDASTDQPDTARAQSGIRKEPAGPADVNQLFEALGRSGSRDAVEQLSGIRTDDVVERLIALIAQDDESRRVAAARTLRSMRDPRAVDVFVRAMDHQSDWELREEAIEALGEIGDSRAVDPLLAKVEDDEEDEGARALAANALANIGAVTAIWSLDHLVSQIPPESLADSAVGSAAQRAAAELKARHPDTVVFPRPSLDYFLRRLEDAEAAVRVKAIDGLRRRGDPAAAPSIMRRLADDSPAVRAAAARALGVVGDARAILDLAPLMRDVAVAVPSQSPSLDPRGELVCDSVCMALGQLGAATALLGSLTSGSADVRRAVVAALVKTQRSRRVLDALGGVLKDADSDVRRHAVLGLGDWKVADGATPEYRNSDVVALLERAFFDRSDDVRGAVLWAMHHFPQHREATRVLQAALADSGDQVRRDAVYLLGAQLTQAARPRILEMLRSDASDAVREHAAQALGHYFANPEDMDALVAALDDPTPSVRAAAISAIEALYKQHPRTYPGVVERVRALETHPDFNIRERVRFALLTFSQTPPAAV